MIINLRQTPSKDDDRLFEENNIKKVNVPEFLIEDQEGPSKPEEYTLEGISGMVIMQSVKDDCDIQKGESATSASRSDNSDNEKDPDQFTLNQTQKMTLDIQTISIDSENLDELSKKPELSNRTKLQEKKN
jgi:hypothetical protein